MRRLERYINFIMAAICMGLMCSPMLLAWLMADALEQLEVVA